MLVVSTHSYIARAVGASYYALQSAQPIRAQLMVLADLSSSSCQVVIISGNGPSNVSRSSVVGVAQGNSAISLMDQKRHYLLLGGHAEFQSEA